MQYSSEANLMTAQELKARIEDNHGGNPTVEDMIFVEARAKGGETKVFPAYASAWKEDRDNGEGPVWPLMFRTRIIQLIDGDFQMLEVILHEKDFGVRQRIWDQAPTDARRAEIPFLEELVQ